MGCLELLDGLARAETSFADGTFKVVPGIFFQLYSIHFVYNSNTHPAGVYCLLPNKTDDTYNRCIHEVQRLVPVANQRRILTDFERAAMNAFGAVYPDASISGCYFHWCQSGIRKVNEVGMKVAYETNEELQTYVRCLPALAFVPVQDVEEAFEILSETAPNVENVDEVTTYFEHTYIRGRRQRGRNAYGAPTFAIELWNQHAAGADGIARTTNAVEGWHHGLQVLFQCHHPTLWSFTNGLLLDMQKHKTTFLQGAAGVIQATSRKYRIVNERVQRTVGGFGGAEVLVYVRAIAHLSHS
jgi:hypothetical protein